MLVLFLLGGFSYAKAAESSWTLGFAVPQVSFKVSSEYYDSVQSYTAHESFTSESKDSYETLDIDLDLDASGVLLRFVMAL